MSQNYQFYRGGFYKNYGVKSWLIIILALLIVGCWRLEVFLREPSILHSVTNEIGPVALFREDFCPNQDGTRIVFSRETENGVGLFYFDTESEKINLLCEQNENGYSNQRFGMLGWSRDGQLFAYAFPNNSEHKEEVTICDGLSGRKTGKIAVDAGITELAWLSDDSFAYLNYNQDVSVHEKKADGTWVQTHFYQKIGGETLPTIQNSFQPISESSVAWQRSNQVWTLDFSTSVFKKIWDSNLDKMQGFTYSPDMGEYQLVCRDASGWYSIYLDHSGSLLYTSRTEIRNRYADLRDEAGLNTFYVKTDAISKPSRIFWQGTVEDHVGPTGEYESTGKYLYGNYLFFEGDLLGQPTGLWQYDLKNGTARCLISNSTHPFFKSHVVIPKYGAITNTLGKKINYHIWNPIDVSPNKKYALILAQTPYIWLQYPQIAAQHGVYFAMIDRPYWNDDSIYSWSADVMTLYTEMVKNSNVDTNRIYLFGLSWETQFLCQLISKRPNLFKGAILIDPISLPELNSTNKPNILIISGRDPSSEAARLTQYQDEGAKLGIPVSLVLQKGAQHIPRSITTERGRATQFAKFLIDN